MSKPIQPRNLTFRFLAAALAAGEATATEIAEGLLARVGNIDPEVGAFIDIDADDFLAQAAASDERRRRHAALGPYDGVPVAIKDCIAVRGQACRCASKILDNFRSPYDATVVERLRSQGCLVFGRANMDEFAMGSSCENSAYAKTANPWDLRRVPGGSSGGSAAAVAARMTPAALGSDTGGSIRQPAAFCGAVGLKPTYGRVSRYGLVAFASSLDQIGPIANDVADAAAVLDIIGGRDLRDCTSLDTPCGGFAEAVAGIVPDDKMDGLTIGLPSEYWHAEGLDPAIAAAMAKTAKTLEKLGAKTVELSLPHTKYAVATYYIIATAEASANLARFDGVRYGKRVEVPGDLVQTYFATRGAGFGDEVRRRILLGTYVLSSGYYDAYYLRAQKVRTLVRRDFEAAFKQCDLLLAPTTPSVAFEFGAKADPLQMYLSDIFTIAVNLAGVCGVSVPADLDPATGMPIGAQFIGPALGEERLLRTARQFELNREIREFIPPTAYAGF